MDRDFVVIPATGLFETDIYNSGIVVSDGNSDTHERLPYDTPFQIFQGASAYLLNIRGVGFKVYLNGPPGSEGSVGNLSVVVRATRQIKLQDDDTITLRADNEVINATDPRLINLLKKYTKPSLLAQGKLAVRIDAEPAVVNEFFKDEGSLAEPEKTKILELVQILEAVKPK